MVGPPCKFVCPPPLPSLSMVGLTTSVVIDDDSSTRTLYVVGLTTSMVVDGDSLTRTLFVVGLTTSMV